MHRIIKLIFLTTALISLPACTALGLEQPTPTSTPTATETLVPTATPTLTPSPTITPSPTLTPTPTPLSPDTILAVNYPVAQERGLVNVEIVRILLGEKDSVLSGHPQLEGEQIVPSGLNAPIFDSTNVVGEIVLRITNNQPQRTATLFLSDLSIGINGKQIRLERFILEDAIFGDDINPFNPDIFPETSVMVGFWFGFEDVKFTEITKVVIGLDEPYEERGNVYYPLGNKYYMLIDVTEHIFESIPEELQ